MEGVRVWGAVLLYKQVKKSKQVANSAERDQIRSSDQGLHYMWIV